MRKQFVTLVSAASIAIFLMTVANEDSECQTKRGETAIMWSLADNLDKVIAYSQKGEEEYSLRGNRLSSESYSGLVMPVRGSESDKKRGWTVNGEFMEGQFLFIPNTILEASAIEFAVQKASVINIFYGKCDFAVETGGAIGFKIEIVSDGAKRTLMEADVTESEWKKEAVEISPYAEATVKLTADCAEGYLRDSRRVPWFCVSVTGDGHLEPREVALARSTVRDRLKPPFDHRLLPSRNKISTEKGYDILFLNGKPAYIFETNGTGTGAHELLESVGGNVYYIEGNNVRPFWVDEGEFDESMLERTDSEIRRCDQFGMPYKTTSSMAHGLIDLPDWVLEKYDLYQELYENGKNVRPKRARPTGGQTYSCFVKPLTLEKHLEGWKFFVERYKAQPMIYAISAEPSLSQWICECEHCVKSWREWLSKRFRGDLTAFREYVGGVDADSFHALPYLHGNDPGDEFGYPMRALYLKTLFGVEKYCEYVDKVGRAIKEWDPDALVTQRYTSWSQKMAIAKLAFSEWHYAYGNLAYNIPTRYGVGSKPWYGIYYHFGALLTPKGNSLGKMLTPTIRNSEMTTREWKMIAFTNIANGSCGVKYSTLVDVWPTWQAEGASLYSSDYELTPNGEKCAAVMIECQALSSYLLHYKKSADIAIFYNGVYNDGSIGNRISESKAGAFGLVRELGYHSDALIWKDIESGKLKDYKALMLVGDLSLSPDIQAGIRKFVSEGGLLIAGYDHVGKSFPGCNSYDYDVKESESAQKACFSSPESADHLGDVLGIFAGSGAGNYEKLKFESDFYSFAADGELSLGNLNSRLMERKEPPDFTTQKLVPLDSAETIARFPGGESGGDAAIIVNRYGKGKAITFGVDLGLVASNTYNEGVFGLLEKILDKAGCKKDILTGNWRVETGVWEDDNGRKTIILVNHDGMNTQMGSLLVKGQTKEREFYEGENQIDFSNGATTVRYRIPPFFNEILQTLGLIEAEGAIEVRAREKDDEISIQLKADKNQICEITLLCRPEGKFGNIVVDDMSIESSPEDGKVRFKVELKQDQTRKVVVRKG